MSKFNQKFEASGIREALRILFKGFRRVLAGAMVATMIGAAVYCFAMVPSFSGYAAVVEFASGAAFLIEALWQMWVMGGGKKRAGAFEK